MVKCIIFFLSHSVVALDADVDVAVLFYIFSEHPCHFYMGVPVSPS